MVDVCQPDADFAGFLAEHKQTLLTPGCLLMITEELLVALGAVREDAAVPDDAGKDAVAQWFIDTPVNPDVGSAVQHTRTTVATSQLWAEQAKKYSSKQSHPDATAEQKDIYGGISDRSTRTAYDVLFGTADRASVVNLGTLCAVAVQAVDRLEDV